MGERIGRIGFAARMLLLDLLRRRIAIVLLFVVPALFDAVVLVTTAPRDVDVVIGSLVEDTGGKIGVRDLDALATFFGTDGTRTLDERRLSLVFLGTAAVSFLACFLAFNLVHKRRAADARLVHAGYRAHEVLVAKLVVLLVVVASLAIYETAILQPWLPEHPIMRVAVGFFFGGLVYGCLGMFVGALASGELEGIFAIVLLTNIDAGWLQNPIYFAHSQNRAFIEALPGYGPAQLAVVGAFTDEAPRGALLHASLWAAGALFASLLAFGLRIRPPRDAARWHYAKVLFIAYAIWFGAFELVGHYASTLHTMDLTSAWDRAVPVIPAFVWPYESLYVFPLLALVVMKDWHRFNVALVAFVVANLTAFVVYLAVPIAFPHPELGSSLAEKVLSMEYAADFHPGANKLPSMHVAMSWIMLCAMWRQSKRRVVDVGLAVLVGLITIAPIFVKQHLIIDVVVGVPWGLASYAIADRIYRRRVAANVSPRDALRTFFSPSRPT